MSRRYLILARGSAEQRQRIVERVAATSNLVVAGDFGIATVLADAPVAHGSPDMPLVIGEVFPAPGRSTMRERVAGSRCPSPASLIEHGWGRYVAVFDDGDRGLQILRDPSGALSCYYRLASDLVVVSSDAALLDQATEAPRSLDWDEIGRMLVEVDLRCTRTALVGTHELLPGTILAVRPAATIVSQGWSPWDHAPSIRDATFDDHVAQLRDRVDIVIAALANDHPHVVATVSGGLDSSIVASVLAKHVELTCLTLATPDPSGDERRYARLVAEASASTYKEALLDDRLIDLGRSQAAHLPRPLGRPFLVPMIDAFEHAIRSSNASAVFNGLGGDNVFCFLQSATPVADRLMRGDVIGAFASIGDVARMTGASYEQVATAALRRTMQGRRPRPWRRDSRFVADSLARDAAGFAHPWLQPPADARLGTGAHIVMLLRIQNYLDPWRSDWPGEVINPLLAQPIVECCLNIPSWHWCRGGLDRAVARSAFAALLPPEIRQRTWKGGPDGFIAAIADRNRTTIRSILVDGMLAERGLIDRLPIETILGDPRPIATSEALRLLSLADAEAWVRTHS